jgi:diacylglycerol kinase (ATP)
LPKRLGKAQIAQEGDRSLKIGVVMNPRAGGGRLKTEWRPLAVEIEHRIGAFDVRATERSGHASSLAQQFAESGAQLILAVGGDGTIGEVADGILRSGLKPELGIIPFGTGVDFPRSLAIGGTALEAIEAIASRRTRTIDAGRVGYIGDGGQPGTKHFINVASLGLSGPTVRAVNGARARGRSGRFTFLFHTLAQMIGYKAQRVGIRLDGGEEIDTEIALVAMANGRFFGAGLMVAPDAELDDGLLDVVIVKGANKLKLIQVMNSAHDGGHRNSPLCAFRRGKLITIRPLVDGDEVLIDIDGESPGRAPMRVEVIPGALTLRC